MKLAVAMAAPLVVGFAVVSCAQVLSIEDAHLDPSLSEGGAKPESPLCKSYCEQTMAGCSGTFAVYTSMETCLAVCANLPPGDEQHPEGNTVQCRLHAASLASAEPSYYCPAAGPGGNGICGSNCDGLCVLASNVCKGELDPWSSVADCEADCGSLADLGTFSTDESLEMYEGAHVECRLFHASAAALDPASHCGHVGGSAPCIDMPEGT